MFRSLLLLAALLPEAHAADSITIRALDVEIAVPTEASSLPDVVTVAFSAPDSFTVEVRVEEEGGGYGILMFDTTSSMTTTRSAHDWWNLCLYDECPLIEVELGSSAAEYEAAAASSSDPEWKYVPVRRF